MLGNKLSVNSILLGVSLSFLGFYTSLLVLDSAGLIALSRQFSIPFRIVVSLLFIIGLVNGIKTKIKLHVLLFLIYFLVILLRIFVDFTTDQPYYIGYSNLILFLFSFCLIPYLCLSMISLGLNFYNRLYNYFLFFSLAFAGVATLSLRNFVGEVGRLSSSAVGEEVISPLILSYCSTLCIGIAISFFISKSGSILKRNIAVIVILLSIVPFFLGASRGSLVALFISIFSYIVVKYGLRSIFYGGVIFIVITGLIYYLDQSMESGLLERFLSTSEGIEQQSDSAIRLQVWKTSLGQFIDNPFFGDRLQMNFSNHYPHNIIIESLQAFGFLGSLPLIVLIVMALKRCVYIFKSENTLVWIPFIFIQSLIQYMFSGTIFSAAWFWISLSLVFSAYNSIKTKYK